NSFHTRLPDESRAWCSEVVRRGRNGGSRALAALVMTPSRSPGALPRSSRVAPPAYTCRFGESLGIGPRSEMPIYHSLGSIPTKPHTVSRNPTGGTSAEELRGPEGFPGTSSLPYHVPPPTTVKSVRRIKETKFEPDPDATLRHRHFLTAKAKKGGS